MRCGFSILGFTYQISGHSQGFFRKTLAMPHSVSPRFTVYCAGAEGLIMSAVGAPPAGPGCPDSLAWMAASVAVSSGAGAGAGACSAGAAVSSAGREFPNSVAQPHSDSAALNRVTVRPDLYTWLKVILPSSTMGWGSSTAVIIGCGGRHTTYCQVCALDHAPTRPPAVSGWQGQAGQSLEACKFPTLEHETD